MQIDKHVHNYTTEECNPPKINDKVARFVKSIEESFRLETFVFNFFVRQNLRLVFNFDAFVPFAVNRLR